MLFAILLDLRSLIGFKFFVIYFFTLFSNCYSVNSSCRLFNSDKANTLFTQIQVILLLNYWVIISTIYSEILNDEVAAGLGALSIKTILSFILISKSCSRSP